MKDTSLIITGGEFVPDISEFRTTGLRDCLVLTCDKGYEYAGRYGICADAVIGDFDSAAERPRCQENVLTYPTEKDDTDTMLAIRYAIEKGCRTLHILCAFGGRMDHAYANIQAAAFAAKKGCKVYLYGNQTRAAVFCGPGSMTLPERKGWSLSVFAVSDHCRGVSIRGAKYSLTDADLENSFPVGVSNSWLEDQAEISLREGILMILCSKLAAGEHI